MDFLNKTNYLLNSVMFDWNVSTECYIENENVNVFAIKKKVFFLASSSVELAAASFGGRTHAYAWAKDQISRALQSSGAHCLC